MSKPCLHCGNPVTDRGPKRIAAAKFCSRDCRFAAQRLRSAQDGTGRLTKPCEICGTEFSYYASMRPQAAYCSQSCKSIGHGRKMTGRVQARFGDRATFTKSMRRFLPPPCALCGWNEAPCDVAHIVAKKLGGADTLENVVMLCPNHHRMFDTGKIPIEQIRAARAACAI